MHGPDGRPPHGRPRQPRQPRRLRRLAAAAVLAAPVLLLVPRPAGADRVADLRAQATAVSQKLVQDQLQIDADQDQYSVASSKVAAEARALADTGRQIWQDEQDVDRQARVVRTQAVRSYMAAGTDFSSPDLALFTGQEEAVQAADEYTTVAVGNIGSALSRLHATRRALVADQAALQQQQARDQAGQALEALSLSQADVTQRQMELVQARVTGQLALAVEAQSALEVTAASAAGTDPALNPFLQCALQAESSGNYGAVSPNGRYMGAFQFAQPTWDMAARAAGRPDLVGVPPNVASKAEQDMMAVTLYALDGQQPWYDRCRS